jgi:hypothetical protein
MTTHRWEPLRRARRLRIILRINGVLFLCTACFLLRVLMLGIRFFRAEVDHEDGVRGTRRHAAVAHDIVLSLT